MEYLFLSFAKDGYIVELVFDVKFLINAYCRLESQTGQKRETDLMDGKDGGGEQTHTTLIFGAKLSAQKPTAKLSVQFATFLCKY